MPRQSILAPGLAALALCLGLAAGTAPGPATAQEPAKAKTDGHGGLVGKAEGVLHEAGRELRAGLDKAEHARAHETPGEPDPLESQPSLAIFTVVVFLGLMFVLGRFAWKPLLAALHQREEHLEHVLLETERARNESEQLLAEHRRRMAEAEEQVRALIEEGRRNAQAAGDEIVRRAQAEAEAAKERAERDIATARDQALAEIWSKTADLAVTVAGKVLGKSLSGDDHHRLVESAIAELPAAGSDGHWGNA